MKKAIILFSSLLLLSFQQQENIIHSTSSEDLTINDKKHLLNYFQQTRESLDNEIKGLSEAQLQYQASPNSWSISQCVEHIIMTEKMLLGMSKELLSKPENIEMKEKAKQTDEALIAGMTNREEKFSAPKSLHPAGKYLNPVDAMKDFDAQRAEIIAFIEATPKDLRKHFTESPAGVIDAYQSFLFLAGHTERHTKQIQEIKANAAFPTK